MSTKGKELLVNEVNILRAFDHPHIVKYYDRILGTVPPSVLMEAVDRWIDECSYLFRSREEGYLYSDGVL